MSGDCFDCGKGPCYMNCSPRPSSVVDQWLRDREERKAAERRALEDARADQAAVWALADYYLPPAVRELGERHKMPETTSEIWRAAFVAGWRACHRAATLDGGGRREDEGHEDS